jgi:hypothetical protein
MIVADGTLDVVVSELTRTWMVKSPVIVEISVPTVGARVLSM